MSEPIWLSGDTLHTYLLRCKQFHFERAMREAGGVQVKAAKILGISFRQFRYLRDIMPRSGVPL